MQILVSNGWFDINTAGNDLSFVSDFNRFLNHGRMDKKDLAA